MSRGGRRDGAGRKKGSKVNQLPQIAPEIKRELRVLAREHAETALEALIKVCKSSDSDSARVSAANAILDRGYGKPLQQIESGDPGDFSRMSNEELLAILDEPIDPSIKLSRGNGRARH
jgi:hypothetical protein